MKTISSIIALALIASAFPALAQDAPPPPRPPGQQEGGWQKGGRGGPMREILESLTPAERQQYMAARKTTRDDPTVAEARKKAEEARKGVMEAEKAAMLKADPTLAPVLDKVEAAIKEKQDQMKEKREEKRGGMRLP